MTHQETLRKKLLTLDHRGYKAYKEIQGSYDFNDFTLIIDYVQGDPFASPSKCRVRIPQSIAEFPPELYCTPSRAIALRDYLTRQFDRAAKELSSHRGTGKSGLIAITHLGPEVLERTSAIITNDNSPIPQNASKNSALIKVSQSTEIIEIRFMVGLPASGRSILGRQAATMLCEAIPTLVQRSLKYSSLEAGECRRHVETVEDADWLRHQLAPRGLVAFIPNGAILPRCSGVDSRPLSSHGIPFQSPLSLQVEFDCPNQGKISGMGIPAGITLIVGGGYHGKSTLLKAIELGIYNHLPGDGRELIVTHPTAIKIRAEEGRSVVGVDISPFINHLPQGRSTTHFSTENASGSTSQAANIMEALEACKSNPNFPSFFPSLPPVLLVDEDTAATNFMIRDRRMQELIAKQQEPITPFIDKVRQLYTDYGVSTILVMGGSGDYFEVADTVIAMENFQPQEVTAKAKAIAQQYRTGRTPEGGKTFGIIRPRVPQPDRLDPSGGRRDVRVKVRDVDQVVLGTEQVDLSAVEQLVSADQLRSIVAAMVYAQQYYIDGKRTLPEILDRVMAEIDSHGWDILTPFPQGDLAQFRRLELAAAINRLRTLSVLSLPAE